MVRPSYSLTVSREDTAELRFESADGVYSKASLCHAETLLAGAVDIGASANLYVHQGNYGVLPVLLAKNTDGEVVMTERSARAVALAEHNVGLNQADNVSVLLRSEPPQELFDAAFYAPRPYESVASVKNQVVSLTHCVKEGGLVFVGAEENTGISRYEAFLSDVPGWSRPVASDDGVTVIAHTVDGSFDKEFDVEHGCTVSHGGAQAQFTAADGLFSKKSLDAGSAALLDSTAFVDGERVLDACCGYGAIGILAGLQSDIDLTMSDNDVLASAYADRNASANGVSASVVTRDCLSGFSEDSFDRIVSNPPTHAGRGVLEELVIGARICLEDGGSLHMVYNEAVGLTALLEEHFAVETSSKDGFVVAEGC